MPFTLADSTLYADGQRLDTSGHNNNLYNPSFPAKGVYSKVNGTLTEADLTESTIVEREHIWPGQMVRAHQASSLLPVEYFSDAGATGSNTEYGPNGWTSEEYSPIAGSGIRFYAPRDCVVLIDLTTYLSVWRPFYVRDNKSSTQDKMFSANARIRLVVDGDTRSAWDKNLPFSAQLSPSNPVAFNSLGKPVTSGDIRSHETTQGFCWSQHALMKVSRGFHEAHLEYKLDEWGLNMQAAIKRANKKLDTMMRVYQRIYAGIRNARVLSFSVPARTIATPLEFSSGTLDLSDNFKQFEGDDGITLRIYPVHPGLSDNEVMVDPATHPSDGSYVPLGDATPTEGAMPGKLQTKTQSLKPADLSTYTKTDS